MKRNPPPGVVIATKLMWLLWALGVSFLGFNIYMAVKLGLPATTFLVVMYLVVVVLLALLIHAVSVGRNWARVIYTVVAVAAVLVLGLSLLRAAQTPLLRILLSVGFIAVYGTILWLLYRPESAPWFRKERLGAT